MTVARSCPTLCDPKDYTVHGILQARILEWVALPFSRGSSQHQGSNPGLLHYRQILYQLSHQGSPWYRNKRVLNWIQDRLVHLWLLISNTEMRFPLPQKIVVHLNLDHVCQESVNYSLLPVLFCFLMSVLLAFSCTLSFMYGLHLLSL